MTTPDIGLDRARLAALRAREDADFEARIPRSLALGAEARAVMPMGVPMSWMAGLYRHPPLFIAKGEGAHFEDVDGNRYLDMNQADLSMNCGFGPPAVTAAVAARMRDGSSFLLPTQDAIAVSRMLGERFGLPCWQYTLSASSANAEAIRVARVATGREKLLLFGGKYHGHIDDTLVEAGDGGSTPQLLGLPRAAAERAVVVPFNDLDALRAALRAGNIADALFILDETHTHMAAYGGLTNLWRLEADMVSLGKSLGGGVAIGAYGMSRQLAEVMERHHDVDVGAPGLAVGGTMYANALSLAAARAALEQVLTPAGYDHVRALGTRLADGIDALIARHGLPWKAHRLGGRSGYCLRPDWPRNAEQGAFSIDVAFIDARRVFMANRGVWEAIATAGPAASFAHVPGDIEHYLEVLAAFLDETAA